MVSIPILHVGVQIRVHGVVLLSPLFQFPYCTWEFKQGIQCFYVWIAVSIPILHVGVQIKASEFFVAVPVSIPILHVGVQNYGRVRLNRFLCFNSHTARGSSNYCQTGNYMAKRFQFPYCTWEFKLNPVSLSTYFFCFNSHTARGSSNQCPGPYHHRGWFQFPYCTWEFKSNRSASGKMVMVSIPILHVGVQSVYIGDTSKKVAVSIPILHVGVQTRGYW